MRKFPEINLRTYQTDFTGYKYSITFVGNPNDCLKTICELSKIYKKKLHIFSNQKDFEKSLKEIKKENLLEENESEIYQKCARDLPKSEKEFAKLYNSSKINLTINTHKRTSSNTALFEILASGGFVITNENDDLKKYFELYKEIEIFSSETDLIDKIDFYLQNLNIAQKIAQLGRYEIFRHQAIQKTKKK